MLPDAIQKFIRVFSRLPSIGPRQATRLAFWLVTSSRISLPEVSQAIAGLTRMKVCSQCFFVFDGPGTLCSMCNDPQRHIGIYMVLEKETDLLSIERSKAYHGRYVVLGPLTKTGVLDDWQKRRLQVLQETIAAHEPEGKAKEIIIALNPGTYGDVNTSIIEKELERYAHTITRLGRGIPTGGEIEFADEDTLSHSINRRS